MILDLSDLFADSLRSPRSGNGKSDEAVRKYTVQLGMDTFNLKQVSYPIEDKTPIELKVSRNGKSSVHIEGDVSFSLIMPCDRCLEDTRQVFSFGIDREIDFEAEDSEEDMSFTEGHSIDVDGMIFPEIIINMPTKVLCSKNCKGICMVCGANLNKESCGCDTFVPDPRMAAINDIFSKFSNN